MNFNKGIILYLKGLPLLYGKSEEFDSIGGDNSATEYRFWFGFCNHVPEKDKIFLRIPEIFHRDAEGRPLYPEQEKWINTFLKVNKIDAEDYWFSHWKFESEDDAEKFVRLLKNLNAYEQ